MPCNDKSSSQAGSTQPLDKSSIAPTSSCCDDSSQQEGLSPPIDKSSIGVVMITMTTAAANNDSLFAATGSRVGANDNLPYAPTSSSFDKSSPLGGSSPTQEESSREPVVIKITTAATVDGTTDELSKAPSNNYSHYQRDLRGDEKKLCTKKS